MNIPVTAHWPRVDRRARRLRSAVGARPVVGITGSCAKTTTKHLLTHALNGPYVVAGNVESYNIIDGIRSTLGRVTPDTDFVVQELSAAGPRKLEPLLLALLPTIGVITAIADDHRTAYESREAVLKEKFKLIATLPQDGIAILNADDPLLRATFERVQCRLLTFGRSPQADFRASDVSGTWPDRLAFRLAHANRNYEVRTRLLGVVSLTAALAAIATAHALGVELDAFIERLADVEPAPRRLQPCIRGDGVVVIRDDYKAAGYMLEETAEFLGAARSERRVLVIGKVSDVKKTGRAYRRLARCCRALGVTLIAIGETGLKALKRSDYGWEDGVAVLPSVVEVVDYMDENLKSGDVVLLKSSAAAHLDRIVLAETRPVRCRAVACGIKRRCHDCPELETAHDVDFRLDET